ncbi:MAG: hypothetical protein D4R65_08225 [Verrucomicrobiaceae bacterium]|nr:MAG: hypothetical protein D4R65_08225 [Verrucomicrobiaceae bacterium]
MSAMKTLIGWNSQDITPEQPVELIGQYYQRISRGVRDPLFVTALAIERETDGGRQQAVMVSLDIIYVARDFQEEVRRVACSRVSDLDPGAIFLNATHIHSGPSWFVPFRWWVPAKGTPQPEEIRAFLLERAVNAVVGAWSARKPGGVGSASVPASVGFCRRMLYSDGTAMMYGETARRDFIGVEGSNDSEVRMLFTWDEQEQLTGVVVNVACPAQVMESRYMVSGDYFGELRKRVQAVHGAGVQVLPQVSAAGCQSPRNLPAQANDPVNYWDEDGVSAIAARLKKAVDEGLASVGRSIDLDPVFEHEVSHLDLPVRRVSLEEYQMACAEVNRLVGGFADVSTASRELFAKFVGDTHAGEDRRRHGPFDNKELDFVLLENAQAVVLRYETQGHTQAFQMELHALRLGDCAFVTNPFELFLDYGQMICARSPAKRTFVVQLACDVGRYLPTARAIAAGGYSALIINGSVGPEGGRVLVDASVEAIERQWKNQICGKM